MPRMHRPPEPEQTRSLDVAQHTVAEYWQRGWAVVPQVFSSAETCRVAEVAMQVSSAELAAHPDEPFTVDSAPDGDRQPRKIDYPFLKHEVFRRFALDPRLAAIAAAFLGETGYLIRDQLFCKPPRFGTAKPYHQENAALLFEPADHMLVLWVALDEAAEDNGCLRFIDASHHRLLDHKAIPGAAYHLTPELGALDLARESVVTVSSGSVVVIHSQTLHASGPNQSTSWRRAYSTHWVTAEVTCGTEALRYGYSMTVGRGAFAHRSL